MNDFDDDDEGASPRHRTVTGRVYVHHACGGQTRVSGGDYTHICDPFWPCTGTFCCQCAGFVPLGTVSWADTGEVISAYRRRMRAETPGLLKVWRFGGGLLAGGALGALVGLLIALAARVPANRSAGFVIIGALVGALVIYVAGTMLLNRLLDIDYRRMR
ncbi:MAG: hypothetical protein L0Z62_38220 [Gemmataceae bacterium]|nr:hypothetical protein [Gemmataceae bacterium]